MTIYMLFMAFGLTLVVLLVAWPLVESATDAAAALALDVLHRAWTWLT